MDPITEALALLRRHGIQIERAEDPWLELYAASGFGELTRNQVYSLAAQVRAKGAPIRITA